MSSGATGRRGRWGAKDDTRPWDGAYVPYDLVKEFVIALGVVALLAVVLTALFSSPDERPSTIAQWSKANPTDFLTTAVAELSGSSAVGGYGPPYNHGGPSQEIGPLHLAKWAGVAHPVDTAADFVINPLRTVPGDAALTQALATYSAAPAKQQTAWTDAYTKGVATVSFQGALPKLPTGDYGPVAPMMSALLAQAQSGGLDGALLTNKSFFQTDYTKPLLFLSDSTDSGGGAFFGDRAQAEHLLGTQWGMMNETGSYPGQVWLWLYTFWYQVEPFKSSHNADALVWGLMMLLSLAFICIPFIPGVRSLPRLIPIHRLIWRDHYRSLQRSDAARARGP
jgi:hypothetical protein